jgi:gliding motility associated protien GldN
MNIVQMKKVLFLTLSAVLSAGYASHAQNLMDQPQGGTSSVEPVNKSWANSMVRDGVYDMTPHINRPIEWQPLREADVMWKKRVWREIDIRQKQNVAFRYPGDAYSGGGMFIEIILDALKKGKIKAYAVADDRFTMALNKQQITEMTQGTVDSTPVEDPVTGVVTIKVTRSDFNPDLISKFRIKEDVIFDRNLGRMVTRIVGLAPMIDILNSDGSYRATTPMFWLYYPEIRDLLAQYEVFNPENDVARMNWDEFFENRFFASYIIKVSNPFDNSFNQFNMSNMDALYEGQRVQEMLFNKEHDMWVY